MPTILRVDGYEFIIYIRDHLPSHVHVFARGCEAIVNLGCPDGAISLRQRFRFTLREMKLILRIVEKNRALLCEAWEEIHDIAY